VRPSARRASVALAGLLAWTAGTVVGSIGATPLTTAQAQTATPGITIGRAHADYVPTLDGTSPIFILLLGSDARHGQPVNGERTDSIHILAINPAKHRATIVGFPRDSYVPIPDHGTNKINSAMFYGGPDLAVKTVEQLSGIKLSYWALTSFEGFTKMIDGIGGLTVDVPFAMHDTNSHADFEPGAQKLNGSQALAFARDRHSLPEGDFGRSEDQGRLMIASLTEFRKEFRKDPSQVLTWLGSGLRNMTTSVPLDELLSLAFTASTINPKHVTNIVLPGTTGTAGTQSIVNLTSQAKTIFADLKNDGLVSKKNIPPSPNASLLGG
jgi:polyisoprenyl-teichoic acid--peptidoglycan teichoic acid transferase